MRLTIADNESCPFCRSGSVDSGDYSPSGKSVDETCSVCNGTGMVSAQKIRELEALGMIRIALVEYDNVWTTGQDWQEPEIPKLTYMPTAPLIKKAKL